MAKIHTHGRRPEPMDQYSPSTPPFPTCSFLALFHCGKPQCVHPTYVDALKCIELTDRTNQHERTK